MDAIKQIILAILFVTGMYAAMMTGGPAVVSGGIVCLKAIGVWPHV